MFKIFISAIGLAAIGGTAVAYADGSQETAIAVVDCDTLPKGSEAPLIRGGAPYSFVANHLKHQGRNSFRPGNDNPDSLCLAERFQIGADEVRVTYAGLQQGAQTLLYRIEIVGAERRELMVLHSGVFNLMSGAHLAFSVAETRGSRVDVYVLYHREPPYKQVRSLIEAILVGSARPIVSAEWQAGRDEPVVTIADADRIE